MIKNGSKIKGSVNNENMFRLAFENAADAILWAEAESGILINANPAAKKLLGYEIDEIIGMHQSLLHPPETREIEVEIFKNFPDSFNQGSVISANVITKSGDVKCVNISPSYTVINGKIVIQGVFTDVSIIKKNNEKYKSLFDIMPVSIFAENFSKVFDHINGLKRSDINDLKIFFNDNPDESMHCLSLLKFEDINQECVRFFEADSKEELQANAGRTVPPDTRKKFIETLLDILYGNKSVIEQEADFITLKGNYKTAFVRTNLHKSSCSGSNQMLSFSFVDITDQKKIGDKLEMSEKNYKTLLSNLPDTIIVEKENHIIYANSSIRRFLGYDPPEVTGMTITDFIDDRSMNNFRSIHKKNTGARLFAKDDEYFFLDKNGRGKVANVKIMKTFFDEEDAVIYIITDLTKQKKLENDIRTAQTELVKKNSFHELIGGSKRLSDITSILPSIAKVDCNLLIEGASGTGKNLVAKIIHDLSERREKPFITINCGSIPESLFESEIFGHVKGAFTDARYDSLGKFYAAQGGTIFLDEIGEMPLKIQTKLLRVIEDKCYEQIGSSKTINIDVRIIAATNRELFSLVQKNQFREDLYYRIRVVSFKIPELKERREDIKLLLYHFINKLNGKYSKDITGAAPEVLDFFLSYDFPGNIRELQNIIEHSYIFSKGRIITGKDLPEEYKEKFYSGNNLQTSRIINESSPAADGDRTSDNSKLDSFEAAGIFVITEALKKFNGNRIKAADHLKISRMQLWRKIKKYGIGPVI